VVSDPLISILIPCHNAAPWLKAALRSAREQTWPEVEIIVVDDGSTDESYEIARRLAGLRSKVLRQERRGASAARNRALEFARGEFIQYLDADDLLEPDKLEKQMEAMRLQGSEALGFSSVRHFYDMPEDGAEHFEPAQLGAGGTDPRKFLIDLWCESKMVQTGQWLTPRRLIEKAGPWNEGLSVDDDGEFFARVVLAARRIVAVPEACTSYRKFRNGRNLSARGDARSRMRSAQLKCLLLLAGRREPRTLQAISRLITREIVAAYPKHQAVWRDGVAFLRKHTIRFDRELEGSPWFLRLCPIIGWKNARRLQSWRGACRKTMPAVRSEPIQSERKTSSAFSICGASPPTGRCDRIIPEN
jgi:glycosyltransferase involved in cell wall biosynthesis